MAAKYQETVTVDCRDHVVVIKGVEVTVTRRDAGEPPVVKQYDKEHSTRVILGRLLGAKKEEFLADLIIKMKVDAMRKARQQQFS